MARRPAPQVASACGLDLLQAIAHHGSAEPLTTARLAAITGRDRGLVSRVVDDLCELGLVERRDDRHLQLSWGFFATAARLVERRLVDRGQPLLDGIAAGHDESVYLVRRHGTQSITVAEAVPGVSVRSVSWLGRSQPVVRGDAGPVLLMDLSSAEVRRLLGAGPLPPAIGDRALGSIHELEEQIELVRRAGFCVLDEQVEAGVASVGAPVRDFQGRLTAAIVVVGPAPRVIGRVDQLSAAVVSAAHELSLLLGYTRPSAAATPARAERQPARGPRSRPVAEGERR